MVNRRDGDADETALATIEGEVVSVGEPVGEIDLYTFPRRFPAAYESLYNDVIQSIERETLTLPEFGMLHKMMVQRIMAVWTRLHAADNSDDKRYVLSGWEYRDLSNSFAEMTRDLLREGREILRDQPYREEIATQLLMILEEEIQGQYDIKKRILSRLRDWVAGKQQPNSKKARR